MPRIPNKQILYSDLDWFAVDQSGAVGHFTSYGAGELPESVACDQEGYLLVLEYFEGQAASTGAARPVAGGDCEGLEPWLSYARRGLYSYDSSHPGAANHDYRLIALPEHPVHISGIPETIAAVLRRTTTADVSFCDSPSISITTFGPIAGQ